jgi:hypothetical protein
MPEQDQRRPEIPTVPMPNPSAPAGEPGGGGELPKVGQGARDRPEGPLPGPRIPIDPSRDPQPAGIPNSAVPGIVNPANPKGPRLPNAE